MSRWSVRLLSTLVLAASLPLMPAPAAAAGERAAAAGPAPAAWTKDRLTTGRTWGVALAVDDAGHHHVAAETSGGVVYLTDATGGWVSTVVFANSAPPPEPARPGVANEDDGWAQPSIALDETGRVAIAASYGCFACGPNSSFGIWARSDIGRPAGSFGPRVKVAGEDAAHPSLKVFDGHLAVAYVIVPDDIRIRIPVWFATNATGAWTRVRLARNGWGPSLRIDAAGHPHVSWADGRIRYAVGSRSSGGFSTVTVPGSRKVFGETSLALDTQERAAIAWEGDAHTWYARQTAGGWTAPASIGPAPDAVSLSVDGADVPHVALAGRTGLFHAWRAGGRWHRETVAAGTEIRPGGVQIRATPSGTFIAYGTQDAPRGAWLARR